jgi:Holliday junction resolvase RusA-like endonuclease
MLLVELVYAGEPLPAPRPRVTSRGTFNDSAYTDYKLGLGWALKSATIMARREHGQKMPFDKPVHVVAAFFRGKRGRVDLDNLVKSVLDAMLGVVIVDDAQVFSMNVSKQLGSANPRMHVQVHTQ